MLIQSIFQLFKEKQNPKYPKSCGETDQAEGNFLTHALKIETDFLPTKFLPSAQVSDKKYVTF